MFVTAPVGAAVKKKGCHRGRLNWVVFSFWHINQPVNLPTKNSRRPLSGLKAMVSKSKSRFQVELDSWSL